jgi:hypothetical protein
MLIKKRRDFLAALKLIYTTNEEKCSTLNALEVARVSMSNMKAEAL